MAGTPATSAGAGPARIGDWKSRLSSLRTQLREEFSAHESARELLRRQSAMVDRHLKELWTGHAMPRKVTLAAVGGYGRGQLFPCSDVDLLILLPAPADAPLAGKIESLISTLWDIGIEVGHSVRTIDECEALAAADVTVQTTLLEARLVAGNRELFARFSRRMREALDPAAFMRAKVLEQQQRHVRYAETNLEPNIKESAGGLRDLQTILWIARAAGIGKSWRQLAARGVITPAEAREIAQHEQLLQSLRIRLHYAAGRREDRLLFDYQTAIARQLGLHDRPHRLASEQLMQRYYRTAKAVSQLNGIVLQNLDARITPPVDKEYHPINERFGMRDELLATRDERLFQRHPPAILESFLLLQRHPELKGVSAPTLRALWRARRLMNAAFRRAPRNREQFLQLLRSPTRVARTLRLMNQYGVILVNPDKHPSVKRADGQAFIDWLVSAEGQKAIADYRIGGEQLFYPNANDAGA